MNLALRGRLSEVWENHRPPRSKTGKEGGDWVLYTFHMTSPLSTQNLPSGHPPGAQDKSISRRQVNPEYLSRLGEERDTLVIPAHPLIRRPRVNPQSLQGNSDL